MGAFPGLLRWLPRHCVETAISTSVALSVVILEISVRRYTVEMVQIDVWHQTAPSEWIPLSAVDQGFAYATRVVGLMERASQDSKGPKSTPGHDKSQDHDTIALDPTDGEI